MTVREILKILKEDGWYEVSQRGSHMQYEHKEKKEKSQFLTIMEIFQKEH